MYSSRRIVGTTFRQSEKISFTSHRQILKNATTRKFNFSTRKSALMRTTKTKYAASLFATLYNTSISFSDQQRSHNLHFLRIADSDFDAFVYMERWVHRAASFLPYACLVVADILVLLLHNLGVVVEVVEILQHSSKKPIFESILFVQLS